MRRGIVVCLQVVGVIVLGMACSEKTGPTGYTLAPTQTRISSATQAPVPKIITADASSLVIRLDDLPAGWLLVRQTSEASPETMSRYLIHVATAYNWSLQNRVSVYESIDQARSAYVNEKENISKQYSIQKSDFDDESFLYKLGPATEVFFLKKNVVAWLQFFPEYVDSKNKTLLDAARIIEQRISEKPLVEMPISFRTPSPTPEILVTPTVPPLASATPVSPSATPTRTASPTSTALSTPRPTPASIPATRIEINAAPWGQYAYYLSLQKGEVARVSVISEGNLYSFLISDPTGKALIRQENTSKWLGVVEADRGGRWEFNFITDNSTRKILWEYTIDGHPGNAPVKFIESVSRPGYGYLAYDGKNLWEISNTSISRLSKHDLSVEASIQLNISLPTIWDGQSLRISDYVFVGSNLWLAIGADNHFTDSAFKINLLDGAVDTYTVGPGPKGIAYDGENIWVLSQQGSGLRGMGPLEGKFTILREKTGAIVAQMNTLNWSPLDFGGGGLWSFSADGNINKTSADGKTVANLSRYEVYATLQYGDELFVSASDAKNGGKSKVLRINMESGNIVGTIDVPRGNLTALFFDGQKLRGIEGETIYELIFEEARAVSVHSLVSVNRTQPPVFDGQNTWVKSYGDTFIKIMFG